MTKKVLLVNPPSPYLENAAAYPPMGLMYVGAALEHAGCEVEIQDMAAGQNFAPDGADLIGFTCVTPNVNQVKRLLGIIAHVTPTMVGGAHPTFVPTEKFGSDFIVMGEFENVVEMVVNDVQTGKTRSTYNGGLTSSDKIQKPSRHLVNLTRYTPGGEHATPVYTSRGCVYECAFCCKHDKSSFRTIPLPIILSDIGYCVDAGFRNIVIGDDNFFVNREHAKSVLELIRRHFVINLRINTDTRTLPTDLLELAVKAGCTEISMGVESGNQGMLDAMNKRTTVKKNQLAIALLKEMGLRVKIYLVSNFPGENEQTIQDTINFVNQTDPDKVLVSNFAPMPGCDVYLNPRKYGITWMSKNWDDYYLVGKGGGFTPCFTTNELTVERQIVLHKMLMEGIR